MWIRCQFLLSQLPVIGAARSKNRAVVASYNGERGTPLYSNRFEDIIKKAKHEAEVYLRSGMDALLIENMHDLPYIQNEYFEPETVACMSRLALAVKEIIRDVLPCGIQILACGNKEALATAKACDLDFIRAEGFVFSHVADEGFTNANAGHILRYRKRIDAQHISIITDIKKKHSALLFYRLVPTQLQVMFLCVILLSQQNYFCLMGSL
ncbi:uncharacterized protein F13E9.13, mitochondrial [Sabethes cyaneus]|uniref:uncharacterized protein F13E9.13, mitochondrial n=1 Tax=Sabethes cyaneus TaxID=53552 RepID=UPI00237D9F99|nr:uncharacterized protein F13E9.13, mitochondrial [Sabethes cyaneus]